MAEVIHRGDIFLVNLNPARGDEIQKTRPCVVVSPDELNTHLKTFIIAPLTTGSLLTPFVCPVGSKRNQGTSLLTKFGQWIESGWFVGWENYLHRCWGMF